jgi:hypothetical protein
MSLKEEKREKAKRLIALALDDPKSAEGANAAWRAIRVIHKYDLLDTTPLDGILENDTVKAVKAVADTVTDPAFVNGLKGIKGGIEELIRSRRRRR